MTGRRYYITSLADWQRHAHRFANSHWIALDDRTIESSLQRARSRDTIRDADAAHAVPVLSDGCQGKMDAEIDGAGWELNAMGSATEPSTAPAPDRTAEVTRVLVLVEADEGVHLTLEDDAAFEALPHPLAQKSISDSVQDALAAHGVAPGATTFDVTEIVARAHPLLRHRVF